MTTLVAVYCITIGVAMAVMWTAELRRGAWARGDRSHAELALHLVAEFATSGWLIGSAAALLWFGRSATPFVALALGMLLYTILVSPGYFIARRERGAAGMFAVLILLTAGVMTVLFTGA